MRRVVTCLAAVATAASLAGCGSTGTPAGSAATRTAASTGTPSGTPTGQSAGTPNGEYLVFYANGRQADALAAVKRAGGETVGADARLGYVTARGAGDSFVHALGSDRAIVGVSPDRRIGFGGEAPAALRRRTDARPRILRWPRSSRLCRQTCDTCLAICVTYG
ncbi:hypothetical protein AB0C16_22825, partial [Nonomuraea sp. NPDC048916]